MGLLLVNGITVGLVYGFIAVGITIVYRAGRIFNIAIGEMVMISAAIVVVSVAANLSVVVSIAITVIVLVALGLATEAFIFRKLIGESELALFLAALGLLFILHGVGVILFGSESSTFPRILPRNVLLSLGGVPIRSDSLIVVFGVLATVTLLVQFMKRTGAGAIMSAVAEDHEVASSMGIDVRKSIAAAWAIAGVIAVLASVFLLSGRVVSPGTSLIGFVIIPVVLLAGLQSVGGTLLAGIVVGIGEVAASLWLDPFTRGGASQLFPYALMLLILLVRPEGMFGWRRIERI